MPGARRLRILTRLDEAAGGPAPARLCAVCADVMAMTGAGIMLMSGDVVGARCAAPTG